MKHKSVNTMKKLSKKPKTYDIRQYNTNTTPTSPAPLHNSNNNHPLSLVPQSYRNTLSTSERRIKNSNLQRSHISHIALQQPNIDDTYEQINEQQHNLNFRSQINHLFSPRRVGFLNRFLSYPSNLQRNDFLLTISDLISSPLPSLSFNSPRMDSDDSNQTVFIPSLALKTPKLKLQINSSILNPVQLNFSQIPFQPIIPPTPVEPSLSPSSLTD